MDQSPDLRLATDTFLDRLHRVSEAQFSLPTPCEGWNVGDLIGHVAAGSKMAVALVGGCTTEEASAAIAGPIEGDLIATCRANLGEAVTALEGPIAPDVIVHHPIGDVPAEQLLSFRIGDLAIHSWDLARATGMDEELPAALVERAWADLKPMEAIIGSVGVFGAGPSGSLDGEVDLLIQLLDLTGRRP
jgi:uncharacterized protein (TIGR03086 family)